MLLQYTHTENIAAELCVRKSNVRMGRTSTPLARGALTVSARLLYTLVLVSVAVPAMKSPPPCQPQEQGQPPLGRWRKCRVRFKMQTPTPYFCAHTRHSLSIQRGNGEGSCLGGFKCKHSHTATPKSRARAQQPVSQFKGAMEPNVTCVG